MTYQTKLTERQQDQAKQMYREGHLIHEIAAYFHISPPTAKKAIGATLQICEREHFENRGARKPYHRLTENLCKNIAHDYQQGVSTTEICRRHDVSPRTMWRALHIYAKEHDKLIPMRRGGKGVSEFYGHVDIDINLALPDRETPRTPDKKEKKTGASSRKTETKVTETQPPSISELQKDMDEYWENFLADMCANPYR